MVELASGAAVVGVVWRFWDTPWAIPVFGYLAVVGLALALIDVDVRRLPDALVLPSYPVVLVFLVLASAMTPDWGALGRAGIGAVALGAFYVLPWLVGGMGLGDVKLAPLLGAALAWLGWGAFAVGTFAAFLIGGAYGLSLLLARRAGRRSAVPFGPWMVLGAAVGVAAGEPVWAAYLGLLT
ncbi:MAG TPA: A24 family peptidase [Actinotalea sp.]|nr:A24 family peptidase [Actinotalea sp.]